MKNYGRSSKLLLVVKDIPDLQFDVTEAKEKGEPSERTDVMEIIDVDTKRSMTVSQNSNFREHSKNSLESVAGEPPQQASEQRSMEKARDPEGHKRTSKYREHSQNSTDKEMPRTITHQTLDKGTHPEDSEN